MRVPKLSCRVLVRGKKSKPKKGHNSEKNKKKKKTQFELSPLIVCIALWIVNTYSEYQENIFSNNR